MLQNAYLLAKIGADTAENEQHSAENLPIGRRVRDPLRPRGAPRRADLRDRGPDQAHALAKGAVFCWQQDLAGEFDRIFIDLSNSSWMVRCAS